MTTISRQKLLALLAQFSISPAAFDALRADAYEKHLAARSLTELEQFYETLFDPALTYRQIRAASPPWSLKKYGGKRPSLETLREIRQRIRLEQTVHRLAATPDLVNTLKNAAPDLLGRQRTDLLNLLVALLGEELLSAKLEGQPIIENLRIVDRLLKAEALRLRYPPPPPEPVGPRKISEEEAYMNLSEQHLQWLERGKSEWLIERVYGPRPASVPPNPQPAEPPPVPVETTPPPPPAPKPEIVPPAPAPKRLTLKEISERNKVELLAKCAAFKQRLETPGTWR